MWEFELSTFWDGAHFFGKAVWRGDGGKWALNGL